MALMRLPNELLDNIVEYTLPQGFESLALACKKLYSRCIPFLKRHHEWRAHFWDFHYWWDYRYWTIPRGRLVAASDLIVLIAAEPIVAQYIRTADLINDSVFLTRALAYGEQAKSVPSIDDGGAIVELFANSTYLRQAGLDWKEYYATFEKDVREQRYSQHGAAFLLTLLPCTKKLVLPREWKPNAATNKLLDIIVGYAKQLSFLSLEPSLASVTTFQGSMWSREIRRCDLSWAIPFLALPHVMSFSGPHCFALDGSVGVSCHIAETLHETDLYFCHINDLGIADFLKHAPRLRSLRYCHKSRNAGQDWDICKFVNAVAREAGSHLVVFSVTIYELHGSIVPGKVSMCNFQQLRQLVYPLELVMCNINAAGATSHIATSIKRFLNSSIDPFVRDLIPVSVTSLSLKSQGTYSHEKALDALFRHFRAVRKSELPNLQKIDIACPSSADKAYKQQCNNIIARTSDQGVIVRLDPFATH